MRKATAKMMGENQAEINKHVDETTFPFFLLEKTKNLGTNGLFLKGYGSPGLNNWTPPALSMRWANATAHLCFLPSAYLPRHGCHQCSRG